MRLLITGGTGNIGQHVTQHCVSLGWDVRAIDLQADAEVPGAEYRQCDITNYDDLRDAVRGCDAVIHLAAIPTPMTMPGQDVFRINVIGTFNMFEAASAEGIRRIAQASSINAFGCAYKPDDLVLDYFPIDEDHPTHPSDAYSLSKRMIEDIGAYYWRRDGISSVALRLPWTWTGRFSQNDAQRKRWQTDWAIVDELAALPVHEREERLAEARRRALEFRAERQMEFPQAQTRPKSFGERALWHLYTFDRFNFWSIVHIDDVVQAFEKSLTADYDGSHALFITAAHNWLGYDTETLLRLFFPDVAGRKETLSGDESLVSIEKARQLIGFEPNYSPDMFFRGQID